MNNPMLYHFVEAHDMVACDHVSQAGKMVEGMMP